MVYIGKTWVYVVLVLGAIVFLILKNSKENENTTNTNTIGEKT